MSYKDARKKLVDAANQLDAARADLLDKLKAIQNDPDHTEGWKAFHAEDARETFSERTEGLSEIIESAASEVDNEIAAHNHRFDLDSTTLEKALRLAPLGDALPDSAVSEILARMSSPAEIKFVAAAFKKSGNASAEIDAMNRADLMTVKPLSDIASQTWYVSNDPTSSAVTSIIPDLMGAVGDADSVLSAE